MGGGGCTILIGTREERGGSGIANIVWSLNPVLGEKLSGSFCQYLVNWFTLLSTVDSKSEMGKNQETIEILLHNKWISGPYWGKGSNIENYIPI